LSFGRDPRSFTARALEACSNAEKVDPQWPQIAANEVWARAYAALYEVAIGDDPAKTLERAEEKFRASIALNPDIGDTHLAIGVARHARILHSIRNKEDPTNAIKEARTALERALALDDSTPAIRVELGSVELDAARIEATHGTDPKPQIDRARDLLAPILKMNPQHAPTLALMADLHAFRAEHARTLHIDVEKEIAEGLISANDALAAFPDMPLALSTKGALLLFRARESSGVTRSEDAQQSASCLDKAFEKNPLLPEQFRALRAEARALQAR
jgi:tetratricopeptide (TPR) repeat protein